MDHLLVQKYRRYIFFNFQHIASNYPENINVPKLQLTLFIVLVVLKETQKDSTTSYSI